MKYPVTQHHNYTVLQLSGEIDLNESPNARKQILEQIKHNKNLLVDLSAVKYINRFWMAYLLAAFKNALVTQLEIDVVWVTPVPC